MNSHLQSSMDIKSCLSDNVSSNPFVLKLTANSTSLDQIQLNTAAQLLKKLSLIVDEAQIVTLYRQSLLAIIQNPLFDLSKTQAIQQLLQMLQHWHRSPSFKSSWPHTRTAFYYLEDKLKKGHYHKNLDKVRLKRAILQPNKKQFLAQMMAENIYSEELRQKIRELKDREAEGRSDKSGSLREDSFRRQGRVYNGQNEVNNEKNILADQENNILSNILYTDTQKDWELLKHLIQNTLIKVKSQKLQSQEHSNQKLQLIHQNIQSYVLQKLPILLNQFRSKKLPKDQMLTQLTLRKSVIQLLQVKQLTEPIKLALSKCRCGV